MNIINETELMANQKASQTIVPDNQFEALQTIEGKALVFSIGTDNILFCTREVPGDTHGWVRVDMSTALSAQFYNGAPVVAKTFDIAQDLSSTNTIDIVLVVTVNGTDELLLATGFSNTFDNWTNSAPSFVQCPFDDITYNSKLRGLPINDVQIIDGNGSQYIIADIISNATTQTISRYCIDTTKKAYNGQAWVPNPLSEDLDAGKITTLIGCGPNDGPNDTNTGGFYILGTIANEAQLQYYPAYNAVEAGSSLNPTIINIPAGADAGHAAIAASAPASNAPYTDLFFASNGSLYFLANIDQVTKGSINPTPTLIYTHSLFQNVQSIHIENWNDTIVLWGQSRSTDGTGTSQVFIMEGVAGQETSADAWSCPIPLLFNTVNAATYINNKNGNNVIFTQQVINEVSSVIQLFQDPVTTAWQNRCILIAPDQQNIVTTLYKTSSYTSHISVTDDNNVPQASLPVSIWASSPCSVYVNNVYSILDTASPLQVTADEQGVVNIMQPVDTIGGISYLIEVQDPDTKQVYPQVINPLAGTVSNLKTAVPDGSNNHLDVNLKDDHGVYAPLVNGDITEEQKKATSQNIYSFCNHSSGFNQDGLVNGQEWKNPPASATLKSTSKPKRLAKDMRFNPQKDKIWGCTFGKNAKYYEGIDAMKEMGLTLNADGTLSLALDNGKVGNIIGAIEVKAGHFFKWMESEAEKLEKPVMQLGEDGLDCLMTVAGDIYHFVVQCMNDIVNVIHTIMAAIGTALEDLIKWIGSLLGWDDILRTHKVLEALFTNYATYCITNIDTVKGQLNYAAAETIKAIDTWAGLPYNTFPTDSYPSQSASNPPSQGQSKPSSNWGHHHLKGNAGNSNYSDDGSEIGNLLDDFFNGITTEFGIIATAADQIKEILSQAGSMSLSDLLKQLVAVIADLLIESAVNLTNTLLTAAEDIVADIVTDTFTKPVNIPVLSALYKEFAGEELSLLGVACLLAAIPVTLIYKFTHNKNVPFPDNDSTTALINAATFKDFVLAMPNALPSQTQVTKLQDDEVWSDDVNNYWNFIGNTCALFGAIGVSIMGVLKVAYPASKPVAVFYGLFYIPYVAPDAIGAVQYFYNPALNWFNYMSMGLATAGLIKSFVDVKLAKPAQPAPTATSGVTSAAVKVITKKPKPAQQHLGDDDDLVILPAPNDPGPPAVTGNIPAPPKWTKPFANGASWNDASPIVESIINLAWEVPTVFSYLAAEKANSPYDKNTHINNILSVTGNTMFNFGGFISPISTFGPPPANKIVAGVQAVMNLGYGAMLFATSRSEL